MTNPRTLNVPLNDSEEDLSIELLAGGGSGIPAVWGNITGTITNQIDLAEKLNEKISTPVGGTVGQFLQRTADGERWATVEVGGATWGSIAGTLSNQTDLNDALNQKVDKVTGKGLSTNDFTNADKTKLDGIATGAEVNVQSDWNVTETSSDAYIRNKPSIPSKTSDITNDSGFITASQAPVQGVKGSAESSYRTGNVSISKENIGLGNVDNTSDANKPISTAVQAALDTKQGTLTAGTNITIDENNVISSTGGGGGGTGGHTILNENGSAMTARGKLQFMGATVTDDAVADKTVVSGLKGDTGEKGEKGEKGDTGNGIASAVLNSNYTLTLNFTDGTSYTTPNPIRGEKGETGSQGPQGIQGEQGEQGERGLTGADGVSPTVTITPITGGHRITITDADGEHSADVMDGHNGMVTVNVTGTTPTITAQADTRYVCGEVATLDFTPPASGICDVVFTSGATATVLTVPSTVKWVNGFDPTSLEANTNYELNIMDEIGVAVGVSA